ncbi:MULTISPECIES: response regulator [Ramlibacter]|nr:MULTISPECIES: response regulator [Ramlibacter]MBA2964401.1 response regulator [Ramlibacter sp. CGMCC 1.13660]
MLEPAIPADDAQRVDDLCRLQVLDTEPEGRFDRITRTAARTFAVPIALVSLVDTDRQWFKSRLGLDATETPRRLSFCAHAILDEGAFVIPDAAADPRFADHPAVTGAPHVRFYAGMPLHGAAGHRVGTLCLVDHRPRTFGPGDEQALADLAGWAELELNVYTIGQATAVAREKEERLQAVLDTAGDGVVTLGVDGRIVLVNPAASQMFGRAAGALVGTPVMDLVAPAARAEVRAFMAELAARPRGVAASVRRELACLRADGTPFSAEIVVTRMRGTAASGYTTVVRDISERKKVERMKNEFIATVSHELRTPLTSVRGSLGLLLGGAAGEIPSRARGLLDIATSNCDRLVRLINDMLDIEKIESGNVRFDLAPQALVPLVRQAMAATDSFAQQFQVRYVLRPDAVDGRVLADADRLTQVVVNLLSNAAKFSPAGGEVEVGIGWLPGTVRRLRLWIGDRGPGIPQAFRDRMFSRFLQADGSDARSKPGTGLGLAISKAIVERLGGRIGFADRAGGGTEFFVELPALAPPGALPAAAGEVLVCEDDPVIAALVCRLLEQGGLRADVAPTAAEARRLLAAHPYRAMTLDLGLPDEDGLSLLRALRAEPATARLPVVVLTARAAPEGVDAAAFGAHDWLSKPIDGERLLATVRRALHGPRGERPVVLHVEDDADLVRVVGAVLEDSAETVHAGSLAQARGLLAERPFALILLDMQLPDGDASGLLAALPARNAATPVVIFSGSEVAADVAAQVKNALVKSRTSSGQLLALLHRLMGPAPGKLP